MLWFIKVGKNSSVCFTRYLLSGVLTTGYLVLLCTVVNSGYIIRPDVFLAIAFWGIIILMVCIRELLDYYNKGQILIIPASIVLVICFLLTSNSYSVINFNGLTYDSSKAVMNDIISQFRTAEENGLDEMDLYVPKFDAEDNWPLATYAGERFSRSLYIHGVIDKKIKVRNVVPSNEKNTQLVRYE